MLLDYLSMKCSLLELRAWLASPLMDAVAKGNASALEVVGLLADYDEGFAPEAEVRRGLMEAFGMLVKTGTSNTLVYTAAA